MARRGRHWLTVGLGVFDPIVRGRDPSINKRTIGYGNDMNAMCAAQHGGDTKWKWHPIQCICKFDADNDGNIWLNTFI